MIEANWLVLVMRHIKISFLLFGNMKKLIHIHYRVIVPVKANVPTISMNVYTNLPNGFRLDPNNRFLHITCPHCFSVFDYLKAFFIDGFKPQMNEYDLDEEKLVFERCLGKHLVFLERAMKSPLSYYDVGRMDMTLSERGKMILFIILKILGIRYGEATYIRIHKLFIATFKLYSLIFK